MNTGSVDVVIPVFNGEAFIARAILSAARQTVRPNRIIVVDDGSRDASATVATAAAGSASPVPVLILKKENGGPNSARNLGLRQCTSEFVAFLDADDEWLPDKLEKQLAVFAASAFPNLGVVYGLYRYIDDQSRDITDDVLRWMPSSFDPSWRGNIYDKLVTGNRILGSASAVLIPRACFEKAGVFDESLRFGEDWEMWIRLAEHFAYDYVPAPLVCIRRHANNAQRQASYIFPLEIDMINTLGPRLPDASLPHWFNVLIARVWQRPFDIRRLSVITARLSPAMRRRLIPFSKGGPRRFAFLFLAVAVVSMVLYRLKMAYHRIFRNMPQPEEIR